MKLLIKTSVGDTSSEPALSCMWIQCRFELWCSQTAHRYWDSFYPLTFTINKLLIKSLI